MNALAFVPILTAITVAALPMLFSGSHRALADARQEYGYSRGFRIFSWVGSILFLLIPTFFFMAGSDIGIARIIVNELIGILLFAGCIYMDKFVVRLGSTCMEVGSFVRKTIYYKDIISANIEISGRGSKLLVIKHEGKRLAISGYLDDLEGLASSIEARLKRSA